MATDENREIITEEQHDILKQFKHAIFDVLTGTEEDADLIRWLRARNFDVGKAEVMFRKNKTWRQQWKVDKINDWVVPEVLQKYNIGGICGFDKEGHPVWIYPSAKLDMKGLVLAARREDIMKCYIQRLEHTVQVCREQSKKLGRRIDKVILINDLEGFTMSHLLQPGMAVKLKIMGMIESNFPETLKVAYVINAPSIFPLIYKMCKPFINEPTRKRIIILGKDWKAKLTEVIDPCQLPVFWGGTKLDPVDGNPYCSSLVKDGGQIPPSFYITGNQLVDEEKVEKTRISSNTEFLVEQDISKQGQIIRYTFWTDKYDLKFGVHMTLTSGQKEYVIPLHHVQCDQVPEYGSVECTQPGVYRFIFDNTYSWFHSKHLSYCIELVNPDAMETASQSSDGPSQAV